MVAERGGYDLMPEMGYKPVNKYLPPRPRLGPTGQPAASMAPAEAGATGLLRWVDRVLSR
jgi:hypothetical protein